MRNLSTILVLVAAQVLAVCSLAGPPMATSPPTQRADAPPAVTLAMTGALVGEFVASDAGLGFLMVLSRTNFDAAMVFAASLTVAAISTLLYKSVGWLEHMLIDW